MPDTGALIEKYTSNYGITVPDQYLFVNKMKQKLTRSGVEYVISKYVAKAHLVLTAQPLFSSSHNK